MASWPLYATSIEIDWENASFSYSDVAIRFGGFIKQALWNRLEIESNIVGYGVMLSTPEYLISDSIESKYNTALTEQSGNIDDALESICSGNNIKNFSKEISGAITNPAVATNEQKGETSRNFYIWNLYKRINEIDITSGFTVVAYIKIETGIVFLNEVSVSAKTLAGEILASGYNENAIDGSLYDLAHKE